MTLSEFSREFDVLYNNIASGAAPGVNAYEKSLFLTYALETIVKEYYSGNIQKVVPSFEEDERKRRELAELVKPYSVSYDATLNAGLASKKIHPKSVFFNIPDDVWFIIMEQAITYPDPCDNKPKSLKITPIKHDYFLVNIESPFDRPDKKWAWRLDLESYESTKIVELVYLPLPVQSYYMRYVERPAPIILEDFEDNPELSGLGLSIRGLSVESENVLPSLDREILELAVSNAILRYRENSLQNIQNLK